VAVLLLLLWRWDRSAVRNRARVSILERLYSFTVMLAGLEDGDVIVRVTLEQAAQMLGADRAEVRLPPELGGLRCRLAGDALERDLEPPNWLEDDVALTRRSRLVSGERVDLPEGYEDSRSVAAVPVLLGDLGAAVMVVSGPAAWRGPFDSEDLQLLEAMAASLGTAMVSSQRLDQLRLEVAAREHQALHDSLTGLGNRSLFRHWLGHALVTRRPGQSVGVMLMDLDGFKDINDTLGHHTGDVVLQEVAGRVLATLGGDRRAARLGGDEFALVIPAASGIDEIRALAWAVSRAVSRPVTVNGMSLELRASLGVAVAPEDGTDASTLLRRADVAMYAAKSSRAGVVAYDGGIEQAARRRLVLTNELRRTLDTGGLEVWYQPVARLSTGEIVGMEALLRWHHSRYGTIPPNEFIPVAEQSGLIEPLTWLVLESSLAELSRWRREGFDLTMAVNVSARSLTGPDVPERLQRLLSSAGIPAADLTLDITESLVMADPEGSARILDTLAGLGVRIAIDDFGTGYSSLSRLRRLPVQTVKVDRSFVMSMHQDESDDAIVRATIELARNMGHEVIAEGVERRDTWERLDVLGCDLVQGHVLAPAMPIEVCRSWLASRQSPRMAAIHELSRARGA
jgi:diguanylate cyclase (GGDEF)-like protein